MVQPSIRGIPILTYLHPSAMEQSFIVLHKHTFRTFVCLPCVTPGIINFTLFLWHRKVFLQPPVKSKIPPSSHLHSALFKAFTQMPSHQLSFQMGVCNGGLWWSAAPLLPMAWLSGLALPVLGQVRRNTWGPSATTPGLTREEERALLCHGHSQWWPCLLWTHCPTSGFSTRCSPEVTP